MAPQIIVPILAGYTGVVGLLAAMYEKMQSKTTGLSKSIAELKETVVKDTLRETQTALMIKPYWYMSISVAVFSVCGWCALFYHNDKQQKVFWEDVGGYL